MQSVLVFDLFGVLARFQTVEDKRRIENLVSVPPKKLWEAYYALRRDYDLGQAGHGFWAAVAGRLGKTLDDETTRALIKADRDSWVGIDEAMVALIGELAAEGRTLALLSNIPEDVASTFEEKHNSWLKHFTDCLYSCRTGVAKPDPDAYLECASRLGVRPGDCLFIDDSEENVIAARRVGMRAEVFSRIEQVRALVAT